MKKIIYQIVAIFTFILMGLYGCHQPVQKVSKKSGSIQTSVVHPDWSKNVTMYEVNVRQFSDEGTLKKVEEKLPEIHQLGADLVWLMPIYPIGKKNRKGSLGSYYSIKNYREVNPNFGSLEDLKSLVASAHRLGMHVILDWVGNHTSWDNVLTKKHPDWYEKDSTGNFFSPYDWTDVIQLDYSKKGLREYMTQSMIFWLREADIDGYRCDYPGQVPVSFWDSARSEMDKIKPVFMLAEDEDHKDLLKHAFDMNYSWELFHLMNSVAKKEKAVTNLKAYFNKEKQDYSPSIYRLRFLTNHDENSWNGTIEERMDGASRALAVLIFTAPGMPLIYNGQEAGLNKRLSFFEKDSIDWNDSDLKPFYTQLTRLRKENPALWSGKSGGDLFFPVSDNPNVLAFFREKASSRVVVVLNLSAAKQLINIDLTSAPGTYKDLFSKTLLTTGPQTKLDLEPWGYRVFVQK